MFEAIILGIIQGITEFLPVSSTAHLVLIPKIFGWKGTVDTLTFDIALHTGTLLGVSIFFVRDWFRIITVERRLLFFIAIATIPAGIAGLAFEELVERSFRDPYIIAISLIVIGIFMLATDRKAGNRSIHELSLIDCLFIGLCQAFAIIPGVSRSGITIGAGFLKGLTRDDSARFSFLLSTPLIAGASIIGFRRIFHEPDINLSIFFSGLIASFIASILTIGFLLRYLQKHRVDLFVYYRFFLGLGILLIRP